MFKRSLFALPLFFACWSACRAASFTLSGRVLEKGSKAPLAGASLYLEAQGNSEAARAPLPTPVSTSTALGSAPTTQPTPGLTPEPTSFSAETDLKGEYHLILPEGTYQMVVAAEGYDKVTLMALEVHQDLSKDFHLPRAGFSLPEVVVTASKSSPAEVSHVDLSKEELSSVAGNVGDVMRSVEALPGVINAGIEFDGLLIRGSGPYDNLYLVDRIPIAFPFHFGGAISTLDSALIQDLDFKTGGFGPPYANSLGGVVEVTQRDPENSRWGFRADVNLLMSEAEVEGPITSNSSLVVAGRRSYLDLLIGNLSSNSFTAVPVFADYQVKYAWNPSATQHWDFLALGSDDRVGVNINGTAATQDPVLGGNFNFEDGYHSQGINYRDNTDASNSFLNTLYHTQNFLNESFGSGLYLNSSLEDFGDWFTWRHDFNKDAQLEAGLQYDYLVNGTNAYFVVFPSEYDNPGFTATQAPKVSANDTLTSSDCGAYFDQKLKGLGGLFEVSAGARLDYLTYNSQINFNPRFSASFALTDQTTLKGSYGWYSEAPSRIGGNTYLDPTLGNPQLASQQSLSSVLGVEQKLGPGELLRVEAYEKDLSQLIVDDPLLNFSNAGTGTARGLEFFLRKEPTDRFFGWVSYSLSDSVRQDGPNLPTHPYDFSEPNILQVVANYKFNPGWDAGIKFLYTSGLPYTPILGVSAATTNLGSGPVTYYVPQVGPLNSQRLPDYVRLDISTSLQTVYDTWQWRFYLEVLNVLFNRDVLGYQYNADYSQKNAVLDLPFLPYVGFEARY